jgi:transcriptional regulator with XRE-family HTH domain
MKNIFFSTNLSFLKDNQNLSLSEMLTDIGFKRTTWSGYLNEKSFPKVEDLLKIAEYFDIDLETLMYKDLSNGGYYEKRKVHKIYYKGGYFGGDSGGDSIVNEPGEPYNATPKEELVAVSLMNERLADKDATIAALNASIKVLNDYNSALNALVQEMGKSADYKGKRSAVG